MTPPIDQTTIDAAGFTFDALVAGPDAGEVVLLLHGFPQSAAMFHSQLEALAGAGYRAIAVDQRGYSPAARPAEVDQYRIGHLVADALAFAGPEPFHVVGHDWGAVVGWHLAARYPERVRTLTALSVPHPLAFATALASPSSDQQAQSGYVAFFRLKDVAEEVLLSGGLAAALAASAYPGDIVERVHAMSQPDMLTAALNWYRAIDVSLLAIGTVTVPTLYIWSTGDVALAREGAEATVRHVDGPYRFEVLRGVSHWIPEEVPEELNRLLLEHLSAQ